MDRLWCGQSWWPFQRVCDAKSASGQNYQRVSIAGEKKGQGVPLNSRREIWWHFSCLFKHHRQNCEQGGYVCRAPWRLKLDKRVVDEVAGDLTQSLNYLNCAWITGMGWWSQTRLVLGSLGCREKVHGLIWAPSFIRTSPVFSPYTPVQITVTCSELY